MGTEFSACRAGINRMSVTSVSQSLSVLHALLLQSKNSTVLLKCLYFGGTPTHESLWDRISIFSNQETVCDVDTV